VTLVSPLGDLGPMGVLPKTRKFMIAGIFYSGMYEYDAAHVYTTISEAQSYFGLTDKISGIEVKVDDADAVRRFVLPAGPPDELTEEDLVGDPVAWYCGACGRCGACGCRCRC